VAWEFSLCVNAVKHILTSKQQINTVMCF